ncbi:VQ motif-containing protein 31 [Populus trichocarpa]|nr:VQ motif-containing protein 31 [Populus trichocarpa]
MKIERHNHIMNTHTSSSSSSSPLTSPTTFVQADINTFRDLVQKLTGLASDTQRLPVTRTLSSPKPSRNPVDFTAPRRSPFKLQERRHTLRKLEIELGLISLSTSSSSSTLQTHRLDSPVTPLCSGFLFFPSPGTESPSSPAVSEEEKAIAEKGFYFHPSPLNTPRGSEPPELLTLFPLISSSQSNQD